MTVIPIDGARNRREAEQARAREHQDNLIEREQLEQARAGVGREMNAVANLLGPVDTERNRITHRLKFMAWPQMLSAEQMPSRWIDRKGRNSVGQIVTVRVNQPIWPKQPPPFVIDAKARAPLFERLDQLSETWSKQLTLRHQLKSEYARLSSQIDKLTTQINKFIRKQRARSLH